MGFIDFEHIDNARNICGMNGANGLHIRPNKLLRSALLKDASPKDIRMLRNTYDLRYIIDLRMDGEHDARPDVAIPGVRDVAAPLLSEDILGMAFPGGSWEEVLKRKQHPAEKELCRVYCSFVDRTCTDAWREIFRILLKSEDHAVLMHCANGKDRTGIVIAVILSALGVCFEDIMADYLLTDQGLERRRAEIRADITDACRKTSVPDIIGTMLKTREAYLEAVFSYLDGQYGGIDGFLAEVCGVDAEGKKLLRSLFLA